jgi:hypothetical protein
MIKKSTYEWLYEFESVGARRAIIGHFEIWIGS